MLVKKTAFLWIIAGCAAAMSCSSEAKRKPGSVYMPDMAYSRAYETYSLRDTNKFTTAENDRDNRIFYNNMPVEGTIARGEEMPFPLLKDKVGDTSNYYAARLIQNPLPALTEAEQKETERLFLIHCGICHGAALDGNGPLYKDGSGPFPAKPANLASDAKYVNMPEGQMFYSVEYGKNLMGSYASQLSRKQRWMIIHYIKIKQGKGAGSSQATAAKDTTATAKK